MTDGPALPDLPPGARRIQTAKDALIAVRDAADDLREKLPQSNDPRHSGFFEPILDRITFDIAAALDGNLVNPADTLVNLKSALRRQPLTARDADLDARTQARREIGGAVGLIAQEIDNALDAFAELNVRPSVPGLAMLIIPGPETPALMARLDERLAVIEDDVKQLARETREADAVRAANTVIQKGIVNFHVESFKSEISAARFETNIASNIEIANGTDFNALERAITAISTTADQLNQATKVMAEHVTLAVDRAAQVVVGAAIKVRQRFQAVVKLLKPKRPQGPEPAQPPTPPPDFDLEEVHRMILRGEAPPATWVPLITELNFFNKKELTNLAPLQGLKALTSLDLWDTRVSDVSPLSGLTALTSLSLRYTRVSDVSPLSGLTALTSLNLWDTRVSDVSPLSGLTALTNLSLMSTQVSDVSPLSGLTALTSLSLGNTRVSDVSPLSGLTALTSLNLMNTQVADVSALDELVAGGLQILGFTHRPGTNR
jgi:hypothetical protein